MGFRFKGWRSGSVWVGLAYAASMSTHQARRLSQPQVTQATVSQPSVTMVVVGEWTGGLASALRRAKRESIYEFAAGLGIGASTVDSWDKHPEIVPRMKMQKALDGALQAAPCEVKQRFIELTRGSSLVGVPDSCGLDQIDQIGGDANRGQVLKMSSVCLVRPWCLRRWGSGCLVTVPAAWMPGCWTAMSVWPAR